MATEPRVLLLDEPTKGVDVGAKADIYDVIAAKAREGLAVVVVSSYLPELLGLCDRIVVLRDKAVAGEVNGDDVTEESLLHLASQPDGHHPSLTHDEVGHA
jgi:ABC-type sugar transport system ATPase subunit